jgi:hypothetical protein
MKKLLTLFMIFISLSAFSQSSDIKIKFKANEEAEVWLGKEWDYSFNKMKNPINVEFDGKKLKMYYDSGKIFWEQDIISFEHKEKKNYDKLESEVYILKIEKKKFIQYVLIKKTYSYGDTITQIKIPFVHDTGEIMCYHIYQEF